MSCERSASGAYAYYRFGRFSLSPKQYPWERMRAHESVNQRRQNGENYTKIPFTNPNVCTWGVASLIKLSTFMRVTCIDERSTIEYCTFFGNSAQPETTTTRARRYYRLCISAAGHNAGTDFVTLRVEKTCCIWRRTTSAPTITNSTAGRLFSNYYLQPPSTHTHRY